MFKKSLPYLGCSNLAALVVVCSFQAYNTSVLR